MGDTKISALTAATSVASTDTVIVVQSDGSKKASASLLPISTLQQAALDTKADAGATTTALNAKATSAALATLSSRVDANTLALANKAALAETVNTVASSGTAVTVPAPSAAGISDITLTDNVTLTFPAAAAGLTFTLRLAQDATGGRTVTFPAGVKWGGGAAPALSTAAGKQDLLTFTSIDGTTWLGFVAGLDMR